jgi:anion-transporting  ArsA/GET3 family ATPase
MDPFLIARQAQERVYLDEIDSRFADIPRLRVPQLPRDVHGIETLQTIAAALYPG